MSRITGDLFDRAADPLQTKTLLWPDGKAVEPRMDQRFDHVKQRLGQLLTQ